MKTDVTILSDRCSPREGARIHGLVLHTTEGNDSPDNNGDLTNLGALFRSEEASAHLAVNVRGNFGRYVLDAEAAWAVCNFNLVTLSLEQIGYAEFSRKDWFKRPNQLHGAAEFLLYGHIHYGVPLSKGACVGSTITRAGVFQHKDFGIMGSGHVDCGPGYPQDYVMKLAQFFRARMLHPKSKYTRRLARELDNTRHHYGLDFVDEAPIDNSRLEIPA